MTGRIIINGELGPIGDEKGVQLVDVIQQVKKQPDATAFEVFINSPGGNVDTGWKIYDYLKGLKKPLTTIGQGIVASMATVVFMAGDKRKVYDNTIFMVHSPRLQVTQGTAEDLQWQASEMAKVEKKMADFYAKHFDVDIDTIKTLMRDETFLTRQQLADFGITTTEPLKAVAKLYLNEKPSEMKNQTKKKSVIAQIRALLGGNAVAKLVYTADMRTLDFPELEEDDTISVGDTAIYSDDGTAPEGEVILDDGRVLTFEAGEVTNIEEPADDDYDAPTIEELQEEIEVLQAENRKLARAQAKLNEKLASAKKDALNKKKILEKLALLETDVDGDEPVRRPQPRGRENKRGSRASAALANLKKRK